ncbi:MAG: 50S ribosomal protein L24 [Alphaproteobacteria bacterium]|nr:50S ribosomal protein L24 [Alphaproteobacteria bacterium]
MAAKIKKGDSVIVLAGKDKGREGRVLEVRPVDQRVLVEGVNMVKRHTKPSYADPQGGVKEREAALHISNVALRDPKTGKATRVGFKTLDDGRKVRVAKGSGVQIDV